MKQSYVEKIFPRMIKQWAKKFGIPNIIIKRNNRMWYSAFINIIYGQYYITFNSKRLSKRNKNNLVYILFHELGHLKKKALYQYMGKVKAEYKAERFALNMLKKHFPKGYSEICKEMRDEMKSGYYQSAKFKERKYYHKAFSKIKEYKLRSNK